MIGLPGKVTDRKEGVFGLLESHRDLFVTLSGLGR